MFFKNKYILRYIAVLFIVLLLSIIYFINKDTETINTYIPLDSSKTYKFDLTGDGEKEEIKVLKKQGNFDIQITTYNKTFLLSSLFSDNILFNVGNMDNISINIVNLSRDNKLELIAQGEKNGVIKTYLFSYENKSFKLIYSDTSNIVGIKDSNLNRTPQLYTLNYVKEKSPFKTNMLVNNEFIDITKNSDEIYGLNIMIKLIDMINLDFEIDSVDDIFTDTVSDNDISLIWKLDKDKYFYTFKNAFFYDSFIDENGNIKNFTWYLTFKKTNKDTNESNVIKIKVILSNLGNNVFKIDTIKLL